MITTGGNRACVVIDSMVNGTSSGGVRITEDISLDEVKALAREMSLKYGLFGLPRGGAKSGIRIPADTTTEEKKQILEDFGRSMAPVVVTGIYYPGMDMNCSSEDLRTIYRGAGINLGKITDTSYFTALSVADAIRAWRELARPGRAPLKVAIEGFGRVANHLVKRLPENDYRITAISTAAGAVIGENGFPINALLSYKKEFGDDLVRKIPGAKTIEKEEVLTADVDILIPSARTWTINEKNAGSVKAKLIAPIANVPYTEEAVVMLHETGIVCLPGFVSNAGSVYASSLFEDGLHLEEIEQISATYYRTAVKSLLERSEELKLSPMVLAEKVAIKRFEAKMYHSDAGYRRAVRAGLDKVRLLKKLSNSARARHIVDSLRKLSVDIGSYGEKPIAS